MRALEHYRTRFLCPCGCGHPAAVSLDPLTEFKVHVPTPVRCHVRTALRAAQRQYEDAPGARPEGLLWHAEVQP
jgi:hypothetical protein